MSTLAPPPPRAATPKPQPRPSEAAPVGAATLDELPLFRMSVEQYHAAIEAGVFVSGDPIELLNGILVQKMTKKPAHVVLTETLADRLRGLHGPGRHVRQEQPVTLTRSEPEPDLALAEGERADYRERHPQGRECVLVVEVADASRRRDDFKAALYAEAGVAEYWIVDLNAGRVVVHARPAADGYESVVEAESAEFALAGGVFRVGPEDWA